MIRILMVLTALVALGCNQGTKEKTDTKTREMKTLKTKGVDPAACTGVVPKKIDGTWETPTVSEDGIVTGKQVLSFKSGAMASTAICETTAKSVTLKVESPVNLIPATATTPAFFEILKADEKAEAITADTVCGVKIAALKIPYRFQGKCLVVIGDASKGYPDVVFTPMASVSIDPQP